MKTRQGRCINSEKCPLSREEEIFTIEAGSPFVCPLCGEVLLDYLPDPPTVPVPRSGGESLAQVESPKEQDPLPQSPNAVDWSDPHPVAPQHPVPQQTVELPLPAELPGPIAPEPQITESLPAASEWEIPAEAPSDWGPVSEPEPQPELEPEPAPLPVPELLPPAHEYVQASEPPAEEEDEFHFVGTRTIAPIDREWWDKDIGEVEDAPEEAEAPAPRKAEKAPPFILVVAVLVVLLIGAGFYAVTHKLIVLPGLSLDAKATQTTVLQISGSSLMGESLMPALAEAYLKYRGATAVHTVAGEHPGEKVVLGTLPGEVTASAIVIASRGTPAAFTCLGDRTCDIGMAARRINADEASHLSTLSGDMYSPLQEHVVGLDGVAVVVNLANPMNSMPEEQIRQFFTGVTTNMATATSPIGPVAVYALDEKSATWEMFSSSVLGGRPLAPGAKHFDTGIALSEAIAIDPYGIGFVEFPFIRNLKPIALSDKASVPLLPTRLTVATEDYLLERRLYLYTSGNSSNMFARQFADFANSQLGQEVVRAAGFVGQNIEPMISPVPLTAPEEYKKLTANARRLSVDFRFQTDSSQLDNKGLADLDRVLAAISELRLTGDQLMLFGFSDNASSRDRGQALSLELAKEVAGQLAQKGITPSVVNGFGPALPVAVSDTAEGRLKNRRVEVWLKQ